MSELTITDRANDWVEKASKLAKLQERYRITKLISPHLEVCNYFAVTKEPCDVCHWVSSTIKQISELD